MQFISNPGNVGFFEIAAEHDLHEGRQRECIKGQAVVEEYGITDIVEAVDGKRRIVMNKVECDLYNYLSGKEEFSQLFKGSYMTNYSWGETTLGELMNEEK